MKEMKEFESLYSRNLRPPSQLQQISQFNTQSQINNITIEPEQANRKIDRQIDLPFLSNSNPFSSLILSPSPSQFSLILSHLSSQLSHTTASLIIFLTFLQLVFYIIYSRYSLSHLKALLSCGIIVFILIIDQSIRFQCRLGFLWEWWKCLIMQGLAVYAVFLKGGEFIEKEYVERWEWGLGVVEMFGVMGVAVMVGKRVAVERRRSKGS